MHCFLVSWDHTSSWGSNHPGPNHSVATLCSCLCDLIPLPPPVWNASSGSQPTRSTLFVTSYKVARLSPKMSERKVINVSTSLISRAKLTTCDSSTRYSTCYQTEIVSRARLRMFKAMPLTLSFPPDFDPSKIKRRKLGRQLQQTIRLMAPFSMRCNKCGEYVCKSRHLVFVSHAHVIDKGKKFNARKETAEGEEYYGIKVFRFYIVSLIAIAGRQT